MNDQAITFDFHNTLAHCPEWFELEVRHLPSSYLRWWADANGHALTEKTLVDADARYRQLRREIIEHGNELSAEACLESVFGEMEIDIPEPEIRSGVENLMRESLKGASPIPGAVETVRSLHEMGIPIGVVSSAVYHPFLEWTLASFGILDAISTVITSASAGFYKSRPEIYLHAAELLNAAPARMIHIGDSLRFDVGGAARAGMRTVWLSHGQPSTAVSSFNPDLTLHTLEQSAPEILRLLASRSVGERATNGHEPS
jgi:HAD superfamily hydrolase (TIGR01509 family)